MEQKRELLPEQQKELLEKLEKRFLKKKREMREIHWHKVVEKLLANPDKLWTLYEMERTGGEPCIIGAFENDDYDEETDSIDEMYNVFVFCDCSAESPSGRRGLCYDKQALDSRKENKPAGSAVEMAEAMGAELMTEEDYLETCEWRGFDKKTSSWLKTPDEIRERGGALFGDNRFERVFVYHNGAESYYAARGFRCRLEV